KLYGVPNRAVSSPSSHPWSLHCAPVFLYLLWFHVRRSPHRLWEFSQFGNGPHTHTHTSRHPPRPTSPSPRKPGGPHLDRDQEDQQEVRPGLAAAEKSAAERGARRPAKSASRACRTKAGPRARPPPRNRRRGGGFCSPRTRPPGMMTRPPASLFRVPLG
ncbi:MAG: hypothetical protein BJ554DRAFT_4255, partial [Olpidium bornovanus]